MAPSSSERTPSSTRSPSGRNTSKMDELGTFLRRRHYSMDSGWSWVILGGSCLAQVILSLIYVVGIFNVIFLEVFQNDRQTTAWLGATQSSFLSLLGLPAGYINSRLGPRVTTFIGAAAGSIGFFLSYFANGFLALLFTFGFLVGIGNGLVNLPTILIMGHYFKRYRNLAFATATSTIGLGALTLPPLINYCSEVYGWRGCMLIMSGIYLQLLMVAGVMRPQHIPSQLLEAEVTEDAGTPEKDSLTGSRPSTVSVDSTAAAKCYFQKTPADKVTYSSLFELSRAALQEEDPLRESHSKSLINLSLSVTGEKSSNRMLSPEEVKFKETQSTSGHTSHAARSNWKSILKNRNLMLLNFHYFSATAAVCIGYVHFPAYFITKGATKVDVTFMLTLVGISNSFGRLLSGALTNGTNSGILLVYMASSGLTSTVLFMCPVLSGCDAGRVMFAIAFSFYGNAVSALRAAMTLDLCSLDELSVAFGVELFLGGVSGLLGPPLAGWMYDVSGDYMISFIFAGCLYMTGTLLMMILPVVNKPKSATSV